MAALIPQGEALPVPTIGQGTTVVLSIGMTSTTFWDIVSKCPIFSQSCTPRPRAQNSSGVKAEGKPR